MGVIYKITEKVKKFILDEKKVNPRISCRALADLVSANFDITLSKSSINNVLKEAKLSSPIGRRPSGKVRPRQKFQIPEKRKKQLLPLRDKKFSSLKVSRMDIKNGPIKREGEENDEELIQQERLVPFETEKTSDIDSLGNVFLRAAQLELFGGPLLGPFLREFTRGTASMDLDMIGDLLLFLRPFGINAIDELDQYQGKGLWFLLGTKEKVDAATIKNVLNGIQNNRLMMIKLMVEMKQKMQLVKYIKIIMDDCSEVFLDPRLFSVWSENVQSDFFVSLHKVFEIVTKRILENVQSVNLKSFFSPFNDINIKTNLIPDSFNWFIQAMDGESIDKRIKKLIVFDVNDQEIVDFDEIPSKKRMWSCGIWPGQDLFDELKQLKFIKCRHFDKKYAIYFNFMNISPDIMEANIRFRANLPNLTILRLMKKEENAPAFFILCNPTREMNLYKFAWQYTIMWHQRQGDFNEGAYWQHETDFSSFFEQKSDSVFTSLISTAIYEKEGAIGWLLRIIHEYAKIRYFKGFSNKMDAFNNTIYSTTGNSQISNDFLMLNFTQSPSPIKYLSPYAGPLSLNNKNFKIL